MKTKEEARKNLEQSVPFIADRYKAAIARANWHDAAVSEQAETNFATSMSRAISKKSRQAGVAKVSNEAWKEAAMTKGGAVIGTRVQESIEKQAAAWGPIYDRVSADIMRLSPRTTDFRTNITNRVVGTVEAWKRHSGKL